MGSFAYCSGWNILLYLVLTCTHNANATTLEGIPVRDLMEEAEHIMVDNGGANGHSFVSAITPCSRFVDAPAGQISVTSEQSTAQWIRLAFHDVISADVKAGTG